jgi:glycosyltransferase involved in cell wall biosynthesis
VLEFAANAPFKVFYCVAPDENNIALARNKAIEMALAQIRARRNDDGGGAEASESDFIAFIDDDEFPADDWLAKLLETLAVTHPEASGVLGPVRPHFESPPPAWILKGRFCDRPEHPTGTTLEWPQTRTGNALIRASLFKKLAEEGEPPFRKEFGTGGEDQDFFRRMIQERGCTFVWCNEAIAFETVPPSRWTRSYMWKRALLRGRNSLKHSHGRLRTILKSIVAVPIYVVSLPITLIFAGQAAMMKCSVKLCDHLGRILTLLGINPVRER